jgi:hypothetical protein
MMMLNNEQLTMMVSQMGMDIRVLQLQFGTFMDVLKEDLNWDEKKTKAVKKKMQDAFDNFVEQVEKIQKAPKIHLPNGTEKPIIVPLNTNKD